MGKLECMPRHSLANHLEPNVAVSTIHHSEDTADIAVVALLVAVDGDWRAFDKASQGAAGGFPEGLACLGCVYAGKSDGEYAVFGCL
jgi:hypothetical protein